MVRGLASGATLEEKEKRGLMSLKRKVQVRENVVFQTDKSGRFSVDSLDNYKTASQPHTADSNVITKEDHDRLEQLANTHSVSWIRILNAGSETGHEVRIKNNMINTCSDNPVAPLYTLCKDHKQYSDNDSGPPVRPVCGAVVGYSCKLSHMMSLILTEVWKSSETSTV